MSDSLRDRIAVAVSDALEKWLLSRIDRNVHYDVECIIADAVIAELGLRKERVFDDIPADINRVAWRYRYTTDWKADDE